MNPQTPGVFSKYFEDSQMEYFSQDFSSNYSMHIEFYGIDGKQLELERTIVLDMVLQSD